MTKKVTHRLDELSDYIHSFKNKTCSQPSSTIAKALGCTARQVRTDIEKLVKRGDIIVTTKKRGYKVIKRLKGTGDSVNRSFDRSSTPATKRVYTVDPISAFDADSDTLLNGFTTEQYYGKYTDVTVTPVTQTEVTPRTLDADCSIDAPMIELLHELETTEDKVLRKRYKPTDNAYRRHKNALNNT